MAAPAPAAHGNQPLDRQPVLDDSDQDAEGEDDVDAFEQFPPPHEHAEAGYSGDNIGGGKRAASGEHGDDTIQENVGTPEEENDASNKVEDVDISEERAVRVQGDLEDIEGASENEGDDPDESYRSESSGNGGKPDQVSDYYSDVESDGDGDWEKESIGGGDDVEEEVLTPNICL